MMGIGFPKLLENLLLSLFSAELHFIPQKMSPSVAIVLIDCNRILEPLSYFLSFTFDPEDFCNCQEEVGITIVSFEGIHHLSLPS